MQAAKLADLEKKIKEVEASNQVPARACTQTKALEAFDQLPARACTQTSCLHTRVHRGRSWRLSSQVPAHACRVSILRTSCPHAHAH